MKIFCMCLNEHHLINLKKLKYIPVGLGSNNFSQEWTRDNTGINISNKNKYYGEYTFYYWFWKNLLPKMDDNTWIGFSGYRYHWSNQNKIKSDELNKIINKENFKSYIMREIPKEWANTDVVLGDELFIDKWKISKIAKHGKKILLKNPFAFLKKNQNIKLHFDVYHGNGILDDAINLLDEKEREDFRSFTRKKKSFNRENLFFSKSKKIIDAYFSSIFPWLERCEKLFGFKLEGYAMTRIYAFLAERYLSYWFNKYTNSINWPVFFFDTNKNKIEL